MTNQNAVSENDAPDFETEGPDLRDNDSNADAGVRGEPEKGFTDESAPDLTEESATEEGLNDAVDALHRKATEAEMVNKASAVMSEDPEEELVDKVREEKSPILPDATLKAKTLKNSDASGVSINVPDVQFFGDGDQWKLLCKASSESEGWMKSTKAMEIGHDVLVQVTTQQMNPDGSYVVAEALALVPFSRIVNDSEEGGRKLEARVRRF